MEQNLEWRSVNGFEGYYEVSNNGDIRSLTRETNGKPGVRRIADGRMLKPGMSKDGYKCVVLHKDGKGCSARVHVIVATAFISKKPDGCQVNHIDGCKTNNKPYNLEWVTPKYNIEHAFKSGLRRVMYGDESPRSKKVINSSTGQIFGSARIAAEFFGINAYYLRAQLNGKNKNKTSLKYFL